MHFLIKLLQHFLGTINIDWHWHNTSINRFSIEERKATSMMTALMCFVSLPEAITRQTIIRKNGSRRARGHIGTVNFLDFPFHLYPLLPLPH